MLIFLIIECNIFAVDILSRHQDPISQSLPLTVPVETCKFVSELLIALVSAFTLDGRNWQPLSIHYDQDE